MLVPQIREPGNFVVLRVLVSLQDSVCNYTQKCFILSQIYTLQLPDLAPNRTSIVISQLGLLLDEIMAHHHHSASSVICFG